MSNIDNNPYITVEDKHGAKAKVFFSADGRHEIIFSDNNNHKFFTEEYDECPIELVEQYAVDWATGKRELV